MSIVYSAAALADLEQIEETFGQVGHHVVQLFRQRSARSLVSHERFPLSGTEYESVDPQFPGMRYFPIRRFTSYVVFYEPLPDGIRVVRVLHSSRDIGAIFNADPPGS